MGNDNAYIAQCIITANMITFEKYSLKSSILIDYGMMWQYIIKQAKKMALFKLHKWTSNWNVMYLKSGYCAKTI